MRDSACARFGSAAGDHRAAGGDLTGILITHEHSDHVQGLAALSEKLRLPVIATAHAGAIEYQLRIKLDCRLSPPGPLRGSATSWLKRSASRTMRRTRWVFAQDPRPATSLSDRTWAHDRLAMERVPAAPTCCCSSPTTTSNAPGLSRAALEPQAAHPRAATAHLSNEAAAEAVEMIMTADLRPSLPRPSEPRVQPA